MTHRKQILERLDDLVRQVKDNKKVAAAVKTASPGDGVEDGTKAPETGTQMASNKEHAAKGTKAMVDGGAKTNPAGASLEMSTDGATAVSTDGQKGTEGADLEIKHDAANGPEGGIKGDDKTAALVSELRKVASELEAKEKETSPVAKAEAKLAEILSKNAEAPRELTSFEQFLVKQARTNPNIKIAADTPDAAVADQSSNGLIQAIQSGQLSEEDAEKILLEAVQSGAISEEELTQAMQELHGTNGSQPASPEAAGAPHASPADPTAGAAAPMGAPADASAGAGAPPVSGGEQVEDPSLEAKMAAANIGPDHELYLSKLATIYKGEFDAGYAFCVKVAEAAIGDNVEDHTKPAEGGIESPKVEKAELKPAEGEAVGTEPEVDNNAKKDIPAAKTANDAAPAAPAAAMQDPSAVLKAESPEEKAALEQVLHEMGLTIEDLKGLMAQKASQPSDPAAAKMASARIAARIAILSKVAEAQEAVAAK